MDLKSKIILIYGPTASGKSIFSVKLARKINGEIINADSMQVYKELNILSARPLKKDCQKIKHHLYGFISVKKNFSSGDWLKLVKKKIFEIKKRNKVPILVGGTGLYFRALLDGLVKIPKISSKKRKVILDLQKKLGQVKFYKKLIEIDPKVIKLINSNDIQRSIRAYEVKMFTKRSIVEWHKDTKPLFTENEFIKLYFDRPRDILLKRIELRVKRMLPNAIKEVKKFKRIKVSKNNSSTKIIGISEIKNFLENKLNIDQAEHLIVVKTRQYAKRQATWARGQMKDWKTITAKDTKLSLKKLFN